MQRVFQLQLVRAEPLLREGRLWSTAFGPERCASLHGTPLAASSLVYFDRAFGACDEARGVMAPAHAAMAAAADEPCVTSCTDSTDEVAAQIMKQAATDRSETLALADTIDDERFRMRAKASQMHHIVSLGESANSSSSEMMHMQTRQ